MRTVFGSSTRVAEILEYAAILRTIAIAAEERTGVSEGGALVPDMALISTEREYGLRYYPEMLHTI